ncbi:hypothetical protein, conserved [Trypanosoma brucei gambiense DAL972]|uniref:Transmembrane protein n=1 Tax=Trypanosoma brucei gambiense (strain MHOM/CI/86/DAL972) TaxID=679716 RepID=C9ZJQ2_TRYB9|nr:hypothetical protein, conserved [Trypanosoma brucei gambiense DAL972]CBH09612.1 hypothetical protein, conserved [Trypanosoma brucei gambiense DAL972]|eukprot:XP_011771916.1 hypothetical protein, conserved [Trypanosoma brucei gambiense DAL972]
METDVVRPRIVVGLELVGTASLLLVLAHLVFFGIFSFFIGYSKRCNRHFTYASTEKKGNAKGSPVGGPAKRTRKRKEHNKEKMSFRRQSFRDGCQTGFVPGDYDISHGPPHEGGTWPHGHKYGSQRSMSCRSCGSGVRLPNNSFLMSRAGGYGQRESSFSGMCRASQYGNFATYGMMGSGYRSFGASGFGAIEGGSMYRGYQDSMPVQKLFSSRRDRGRVPSQVGFFRRPSQLSWSNSSNYVQVSKSLYGIDGGVSKEPARSEVGRKFSVAGGATMSANGLGEAKPPQALGSRIAEKFAGKSHSLHPREGAPIRKNSPFAVDARQARTKSPASYDLADAEDFHIMEGHASPVCEATRAIVETVSDGSSRTIITAESNNVALDIPLSRTVGEVVHPLARVGSAFGEGTEDTQEQTSVASKGETSNTYGRHRRPFLKRSSSLHRPRGVNAVNISIAEFPEAEEVQDSLEGDILNTRNSTGVPHDTNRPRRNQVSEACDLLHPTSNEETAGGGEKFASLRPNTNRGSRMQAGESDIRGKLATDGCTGCGPDIARTQSPGSQGELLCDGNTRAADGATPVTETASIKESQRRTRTNEEQRHPKDLKTNRIKTVVLVEKVPSTSTPLLVEGNNISYRGSKHEAHEVVIRNPSSTNFYSTTLNGVKDAVCDGYNASVLSVEAPNSDMLFRSPVWPYLTRIVRGVLQRCQTTADSIVSVTSALGFFHDDKVKDLFDLNGGRFETMQVQPSPIYGPRIPQLRYTKVTSSMAFDESLNKALSRASTDPILSTMTGGVLVALLLVKQSRIVRTESGESTCDVLLSSLVFASSGSGTHPYDSAISRVKNEYCMLFHLVLGGPSHTCFLLSLSTADESDEEVNGKEIVENLLELHRKMHSTYNYPLRNGSVTRFVKYVMAANKEGIERLKHEEDPEKKNRLKRYVQEQTRLLNDATKMLKDAEAELRARANQPR